MMSGLLKMAPAFEIYSFAARLLRSDLLDVSFMASEIVDCSVGGLPVFFCVLFRDSCQ